MAVSEGELYILDQQLPRMGWDNRSVGTRQRWLITQGSGGLYRKHITMDAYEQFIRNTLIKDKPEWPAPIPGTPGTSEQANGWDWGLLQQTTTLAS